MAKWRHLSVCRHFLCTAQSVRRYTCVYACTNLKLTLLRAKYSGNTCCCQQLVVVIADFIWNTHTHAHTSAHKHISDINKRLALNAQVELSLELMACQSGVIDIARHSLLVVVCWRLVAGGWLLVAGCWCFWKCILYKSLLNWSAKHSELNWIELSDGDVRPVCLLSKLHGHQWGGKRRNDAAHA